jgi:hypothetical protein
MDDIRDARRYRDRTLPRNGTGRARRTMAPMVIATLLAVLPCGVSRAQERTQERATEADAKALLDKAVAHYKSVGRDRAFQDFAVRDGAFFMRDLYVYCDRDGQPPTLSFHPIAKALINHSIDNVVDNNGRLYGVIMLRDALRDGTSKVDYAWPDPVTKKIMPKTALAAKVADDEVCAVGFYR